MIRYKLTRQDRTSCVIDGRSGFSWKYLKDTVVTADPQTPGIFTFKTKAEARNFMWYQTWLILKVQPIGKGTVPKLISHNTDKRSLIRFFKELSGRIRMKPPRGTICYPAVKVLD